MAKCPECGHQEAASIEWMESVVEGPKEASGLVICPECDAVLGGLMSERAE